MLSKGFKRRVGLAVLDEPEDGPDPQHKPHVRPPPPRLPPPGSSRSRARRRTALQPAQDLRWQPASTCVKSERAIPVRSVGRDAPGGPGHGCEETTMSMGTILVHLEEQPGL